MRIKVTGQKQLRVIGKELPMAQDGMYNEPPVLSAPGNFFVYGPNGEVLQEMNARGEVVKDFSKQQSAMGNTNVNSAIQSGQPSFNTGMFQNMPQPPSLQFPTFKQSFDQTAPGKCPPGQQKNPLTNTCEPIKDFTKPVESQSSTPASKFNGKFNLNPKFQKYSPELSFKPEGEGWIRNPETGKYSKPDMPVAPATTTKTKSYREYNAAIPSMITAGMAGINSIIQNTKGYNDEVDYAKKLGQTNASEPTVRNVYSRGRHVMNAPFGADYAPNMMTPVQFQGRPVSEYTGFPAYGRNTFASKNGGLIKAADGMGMPDVLGGFATLTEIPGNYAAPEFPEMRSPEIPRYERPAPVQREMAPMSEESTEMSSEFAMPLKSIKITSGFGHRGAPMAGASTEHNGIDLAAPLNTPIYSPMDGVVEIIKSNGKGGKQIIVRHSDGSRSGFAHLNSYNVGVGDNVSKGDRLGLSGNTGNSTGPHLHFTFRSPDGNFVDPADYFKMGASGKAKPMTGISNLDHNNPGNIHFGGFAKGYGAVAGRQDNGGRVAVFPNMEIGLQAMEDLLFNSKNIDSTISQVRHNWVNGPLGGPTASSAPIVKAMGGDYRMRDLNESQRKKVKSEFIKWEDRKVYDNLRSKGLVFKEGGEYELSDDEINDILANGGEVEYL